METEEEGASEADDDGATEADEDGPLRLMRMGPLRLMRMGPDWLTPEASEVDPCSEWISSGWTCT